jgi:hypothetical protein
MEKIAGILLNKAWPLICATAVDMRVFIQSPASFLNLMKVRSELCPKAWFFGLIAAVGLGILGLPALRLAGLRPSLEIAGVMTVINFLLIAIYGVCFGLATRMFASPRSMMVTVNTFFYLSAFLVVLKLFESPALGARFAAMLQTCSSMDYSDAVTTAIQRSQATTRSNIFVGAGYVLFTGLLTWVHKVLHDFGWLKSLTATIMGMALLSAVVAYVQEPVIAQMVCAYGGDG